MRVILIVLLFYMGSAGAATVGEYSSFEACEKAAKESTGRANVVYRCVQLGK